MKKIKFNNKTENNYTQCSVYYNLKRMTKMLFGVQGIDKKVCLIKEKQIDKSIKLSVN